jgi:phosphate transport system substrate-binding protein
VADSTGCLDFARSSRGKSGTDPSTLEFYAYAKDALTWGRFPNACAGGDLQKPGCAPGNLTVDQIRGIYNCTEPGGLPLYTDWSQVGGDAGAIKRFLPQTGSGTLSFFETKILGLSSAQQGVLDSSSCATPPTRTQEHDATQVPVGDRSVAITPFSYAKWNQMVNDLIPDLRAGVKLAKINSVKPTETTISDNTFFGVRYIYNVAKTTTPHYGQVMRLIGVNATGNGYICSGVESSNITLYGFVPLTSAPAGPGLPNSNCRLNPTPL